VKTGRRIIARIGLAGGLALLVGCIALQPPSEREAPADITFRGLHVDQFRSGTLSARAVFETLDYRRDASKADARNAVIRPVDHGETSSTITAGTASSALKQGTVQLAGGVTYDALTGDRTETEACTVNLVNRTATGDRPVTVRGAGYRVEGAAFDATFRSQTVLQLKGGVHSVLDEEAPAPARHQSTGRLK
jgi:LPS export ABC transporter protein LptC